MWKLKGIVFIICFLWTALSWATEIYLKNGDKISGVIAGDDGSTILVQTLEAGEIKINKSFVDLPKTYPEQYQPPKISQQNPSASIAPAPAIVWKKDVALGYTQMGGNTKSDAGQLTVDINRKTSTNEATLKYDASYSSSNNIFNGRKFYGMLRYANSFGKDLKWYNFYKMEGDQDRFADIYYRLTPSIGRGYWFFDSDDLKAMVELGVGYQYTAYYSEIKSMEGPVIVPRFFIDKRLIGNLHLSEDFTLYPSLDNFSDYRFRSETDLVNKITKAWSLKISYVDDFNSNPPPDFKKQDYTWLTSLEYHF